MASSGSATPSARPAAFVCWHLLGICDGSRGGFIHPTTPTTISVGADACERLRAGAGEWNDRSEAHADIRLICINCFQQARATNREF
jgi:hypothetical protein